MLGTRIGTRVGANLGTAVGTVSDPISPSSTNPLGSVSRDATSGIYVPANASEWTTLMSVAGLATGNPSALSLCQEASGNLADSIGAFTLTATGTGLSYQNAVTGWSRLAVNTTDAGTGRFQSTDAGLPDILTNSILLLAYEKLNATPGAIRVMLEAGTTNGMARVTTVPRLRGQSAANTLDGGVDPTGAVRPIVVRINRTASTCTIFSDQEKVTPAFGATMTGKRMCIAGASTSSPNMSCLYFAAFFNAAAELSDAQVKTLLQTLGWTIPWS